MEGIIKPNQTEPSQEGKNSSSPKSEILRGSSRRGFFRLIGAAALAPVTAQAMDQSTRNILLGFGAAAVAERTGVVIQPDPNGRPTVNVGATLRNRDAMEQQRARMEQVAAQQREAQVRTVQQQQQVEQMNRILNAPTSFDQSQANPELERMGIVAVNTPDTLYLYHKDTINKPGFLESRLVVNSSFLKNRLRIDQNDQVKILSATLVPVPGFFIMKINAIVIQNGKPFQLNTELNITLDQGSNVVKATVA